MQKVRWAVLGTSNFALDWIARGVKLADNAELVAIVSRDPERGRAACEKLDVPRTYNSIQAIDTNEVDGIFMTLPNTLHAPMAIEAIRHGLHVVGEKPMAISTDECREMIAAAQAAGVTLACAQCMEWTSPIIKTRELLADGVIGDIVSCSISASYRASPDPEGKREPSIDSGGGQLFDMGVHAIDAITRLLGPIEQVAGYVGTPVKDYLPENGSIVLAKFASGVMGTVEAHGTCYQNSFVIQGTRGRIWSDEWWGREFAGDLHMQVGDDRTDFDLPKTMVYKHQAEHVSQSIMDGKPPVISGERGMANIAVIEAAIQSWRTGQFVNVRSS
jgi:predicted dehydrogenase